MKIILVNTDPMVAKLIEATAKKTGITLASYASTDEVDSLVLVQESFVFIDEGAIGADDDRVKSIAQGFLSCLLYAKTTPMKEFSYTVKKPFLPTEILDILQAELLKLGQDLRNASNITKDQITESSEADAPEMGAERAGAAETAGMDNALALKDLDLGALDRAGKLVGDLQEGLDLGDELELELPESLDSSPSIQQDRLRDETLDLDSPDSSMPESSMDVSVDSDMADSCGSREDLIEEDLIKDSAEPASELDEDSPSQTTDAAADEPASELGDDFADMLSSDLAKGLGVDAQGAETASHEISDDWSNDDSGDEAHGAITDEPETNEAMPPESSQESSPASAASIESVENIETAEPLELLGGLGLSELGEEDFIAEEAGAGDDLAEDLAGLSKELGVDSPDPLGGLESGDDLAQTEILPQDEIELVKTLLEDPKPNETDEQEASEQEAGKQAGRQEARECASDDMPDSDIAGDTEERESSADFLAESSALDSNELGLDEEQETPDAKAAQAIEDTQEVATAQLEHDAQHDEQSAQGSTEELKSKNAEAENETENIEEGNTEEDMETGLEEDLEKEVIGEEVREKDFMEEDFADIALDDLAQVDTQAEAQADTATDTDDERASDEAIDFLQLSEREICEVLGEEVPEDVTKSQEASEEAPHTSQSIEKSAAPDATPDATEGALAESAKALDTQQLLDSSDSADIAELAGSQEAAQEIDSAMGGDIADALHTQAEHKAANKAENENANDAGGEPSALDLASLGEIAQGNIGDNGGGDTKESVGWDDTAALSVSELGSSYTLEACEAHPDPDSSLLAREATSPQNTQSLDSTNDLRDDVASDLANDFGEFGAGLQAINALRDEMQSLGDLDPFASSFATNDIAPSTSSAPAPANRTQEELFSELLANKSAQEIRSLLNGAQISINISFSDKS